MCIHTGLCRGLFLTVFVVEDVALSVSLTVLDKITLFVWILCRYMILFFFCFDSCPHCVWLFFFFSLYMHHDNCFHLWPVEESFFMDLFVFTHSMSPVFTRQQKIAGCFVKWKNKHYQLLNMFGNLQVTSAFSFKGGFLDLWDLRLSCVVFPSMMSLCLPLWPQSWEDFTSTLARCSSEQPLTQREKKTR